jgi:hypothetical protein
MNKTPKQALDELAAILIHLSGIPCEKFSAASNKDLLVVEVDGWYCHMNLKKAAHVPQDAAKTMRAQYDKHQREMTMPMDELIALAKAGAL